MQTRSIRGHEIWGRMSSGGMSDVWLARHSALAVPVVVKTLRAGGHELPGERYALLLAEARLMARVASPYVVQVRDAGVCEPACDGDEGVPYLIEEYVDGLDLAELDQRRRRAVGRALPLWCVAKLVAQAAEGLHAAHQAGVIHRDVKPSNLFGGAGGAVKVGDFGVAVTSSEARRELPAGTPLFMAPEQLRGERVDRRSDVWSLGATAFALRYGCPAFASMSDAASDGAQPRFPAPKSPEEAYFQHLVARMLAPRAAERYENLRALRPHLEALSRVAERPLQVLPRSASWFELGGTRVTFESGDLAQVETDAIVNSAYSEMSLRSGVGAALKARGGDAVEASALAGGPRALGECVAGAPGSLACRTVLHAVGAWNEVSCVARATQRALLLAEELGHVRVALPAIGTGRGGVSLESCADAMVSALRFHLELGGSRLREVRFVLYDEPAKQRFLDVAQGVLLGEGASSDHAERGDAAHDAGRAATVCASTSRLVQRAA